MYGAGMPQGMMAGFAQMQQQAMAGMQGMGAMQGYQAQAQAQAQQQQRQAQQQQQAMPQQQMAAAGGGSGDTVGNSRQITVSGCAHGTVGSIVRGSFTAVSQNHGKPAYKKDAQVNGLDVMLYFWDERDGKAFSGWWFGPKVGGDQVWAYHPSNTPSPPKSGWKVPCDGPVDPTFAVSAAGAAAPAQQQQAWGGAQQTQPAWAQPAQGWGAQQQQQQQAAQSYGAAYGGCAAGGMAAAMGALASGGGQQQQQMAAMQMQQKMQQEQQRQQQLMKIEQMKKQQEELRKKQAEDMQRKTAELAQKRAEQASMVNVRRVLGKIRTATPDTLEALKKEVMEALAKELPNCGSQGPKITEEVNQAIQMATTKIEMVLAKKKEAEERKAELEKKRLEARATAETLLKEMSSLVEAAEGAVKTLKNKAEPLKDATDMKPTLVEKTSKKVDEASALAKEKVKAVADFLKEKAAQMRVPKVGDEMDMNAELQKLFMRHAESTKELDVTTTFASETVAKTLKKAEASKKLDAINAVFTKFDKDKDGFLSKPEVKKYALDAFKFKVSDAAVEKIFKNLVHDGSKGVKKSDFQMLKVQVGVAREVAADAERKKVRLEYEAKLEELKKKFQARVDVAAEAATAPEVLVKKAEDAALPAMGQAFKQEPAELVELADELEKMSTEATESIAKGKEAVSGLSSDVEEELQQFMTDESKKLENKLKTHEIRLTKVVSTASKLKDIAKKKEAAAVDACTAKVVAILRYHRQQKKLSADDMLKLIAADGKITEDKFVKFLGTCLTPPKAKPVVVPKKEGEAAADGGEDEPEPVPEPEKLKMVFKKLDEEGAGVLSAEQLGMYVRHLMKVISITAIMSKELKPDSEAARKLDRNELVEVIEGPTQEEVTKVMRVKVAAVKDGAEGYVTLIGNLREGGRFFKVMKETTLTENFDIEAEAAPPAGADATSVRKLKAGEVVEVLEFPRKEEKSGLTRMKCKAKLDSKVGYATVVGNGGTVFMDVA